MLGFQVQARQSLGHCQVFLAVLVAFGGAPIRIYAVRQVIIFVNGEGCLQIICIPTAGEFTKQLCIGNQARLWVDPISITPPDHKIWRGLQGACGFQGTVQGVQCHFEIPHGVLGGLVWPQQVHDLFVRQPLPPVGEDQLEQLARFLALPLASIDLPVASPGLERSKAAYPQGIAGMVIYAALSCPGQQVQYQFPFNVLSIGFQEQREASLVIFESQVGALGEQGFVTVLADYRQQCREVPQGGFHFALPPGAECQRQLAGLPGELVLHAVEEVRPLVTDRRHQLSVQVAEQPLYVAGDATRLLQILGNLLTNAAKYTPPGGQISLRVQPDGDAVEIRVRDTGEGIPQDMLEAVFDLFVQSHASLERSEGGMGVGLTLVRNLVELHGGSVRACSDGPGRGSEFVVRLPLSDERPPSAAGPDASPADVAVTDPARLRVLLVEDNADSREMLKSWLELDGYRVESADSGASGLEKLLSDPPDVALVDIGLPEIDGYEVARRVRASVAARQVRLVAVTGYGRSEDHRAILEAGFDEHLVKPVDPRNLAQALNKPR